MRGTLSRDSRERFAEHCAHDMVRRMHDKQIDTHAAVEVATLWILCIYDVLRLEDHEWRSMIGRYVRSFDGHTWSGLVRSLKHADETLLWALTGDHQWDSLANFKHWYAVESDGLGEEMALLPPLVLKLMFSCIETHDVRLFQQLHQVFCFPTRADVLTGRGRARLQKECIDRFFATENRIASIDVQPDTYGFFSRYLRDYDPYDDFVGHFSNGSALTERSSSKDWYTKWRSMRFDTRLDYLWWQIGYKVDDFPLGSFPTCARFKDVPKDATKERGITIEPALSAYLQQGFMRSLRRYIRNHPYLSRRIDFTHPEKSAALALNGSIDGGYATIDLSDASDSIRWNQLEYDCRDLPLREALDMCRSRQVIFPGGTACEVAKFAGMGNALTFTIECLVFCKIVEQGIRDAGGSVSKSRYRVYGDDIVVETIYAESVMHALEREGFKINREKSCLSDAFRFREACGGEFVDGISVKPIRLPRGEFYPMRRMSRHKSEWIVNHIDIANTCYGILPSVRLYIIHRMFTVLRRQEYPVFTVDGSVGFKSDQATNYHLVHKPVRHGSPFARYQYETVCKHGQLVPVKRKRFIPDDVTYRYRLNQLALMTMIESNMLDQGLDPLRPDQVVLSDLACGVQWKSVTEPDYYSGPTVIPLHGD